MLIKRWIDKDVFLSDHCKKIQENTRIGKARYLFKKIRDTKVTFHAKMGSIKDRNVSLASLIFLKRNLVFPILLFSSISLHWSLRKTFLSLLLFFETLHSNRYIFPFLLCLFALLLFSAICKSSSDNHFAFLHFFFLGMVSITASCTMSWTSVHSSSGTLWDLIPWIYLSLPLYNHKGLI